ncbi:hypothetical protein [Streptomyces sp. NBC_01431]|uniref:hypothetical protein n=1 Tax=Streptomyces sp. NBC_01431 TaxID=2903863 RepID=UPI002E2F59B7|nr:hypothetical protein [Streptomyces sp. NBC_01431]
MGAEFEGHVIAPGDLARTSPYPIEHIRTSAASASAPATKSASSPRRTIRALDVDFSPPRGDTPSASDD